MKAPHRLLQTSRGTLELGGRPWLMGIVNASPECAGFVAHLRSFVTMFEIKRYLAALESIRSRHA